MGNTEIILVFGFAGIFLVFLYLAFLIRKLPVTGTKEEIQSIRNSIEESIPATLLNNQNTIQAKFSEIKGQISNHTIMQTTANSNFVTAELFQNLLDETRSFNRVISNPQDAGSFGEDSLENFLEMSGISEDHYNTQTSYNNGDFRPDAEIDLPGKGKLLIDAKTPTTAWANSLNAQDDGERNSLLKENANNLKSIARDLSTKGYHQIEGFTQPDFVVMYIPLDIIYLEFKKIAGNDFLDDATKGFLNTNGVRGCPIIFAPPALIGGVLRMVRLLWREKNSHEENAELVSEIIKFANQLKFLAKDLIDAGNSHHKSGNSLRKAFKRLSSANTHIDALKGVMEAEDLVENLETEFMSAPSNSTDINADFIIDWISNNQSSLPEGFIEKLMQELRN